MRQAQLDNHLDGCGNGRFSDEGTARIKLMASWIITCCKDHVPHHLFLNLFVGRYNQRCGVSTLISLRGSDVIHPDP